MNKFKAGDKVRPTIPNSVFAGKVGEVVYCYADGLTYRVVFEAFTEPDDSTRAGAILGFFESELELMDEKQEALIELAETLDRARLQANAIATSAEANPNGVYGNEIYEAISKALTDTLCEYCRQNDQKAVMGYNVYDSLLDGNTVRQAIAAVVK